MRKEHELWLEMKSCEIWWMANVMAKRKLGFRGETMRNETLCEGNFLEASLYVVFDISFYFWSFEIVDKDVINAWSVMEC